MARKQKTVVEVQCDRCTRTEERPGDLEKETNLAAFEGKMFGLVARFEDLCAPCFRTVKNHLEQIAKKLDGVSPDRVVKDPNEVVVLPMKEEPSQTMTLPVPTPATRGPEVTYSKNKG